MRNINTAVGPIVVRFLAIMLIVQILSASSILTPRLALADEPPTVAWVRQFGTSGYDQVNAVAADVAGNAYAAGSTTGAFPGYLTSVNRAAFLTKFSSTGTQLWIREAGSVNADTVGTSVAVDPAGNVYLGGGQEQGSSSFPNTDALLQKYNASGQELWTRQFGNPQSGLLGMQNVQSVATDLQGNVYVAGLMPLNIYMDTIYDPDTDTYIDTYLGEESGAYLRKYDGLGNELWTRQFGIAGSSGCSATGVTMDDAGNPLVTGTHWNAAGAYGVFVKRYNVSGALQSEQTFATVQGTQAYGASLAYVAGRTLGALPAQTSAGVDDAFITSYGRSESEIWTRQFGTSGVDRAVAVTSDAARDVTLFGDTTGAFSGAQNAGPAGTNDAFASKYDSLGGLMWNLQFGTDGIDYAGGIAAYGVSDFYAGGATYGTFAGQTHYGAGSTDAFLVKLVDSSPRMRGDVNHDGLVTLVDLTLLASSFGRLAADPVFNANADLNGDGTVNILDLVEVGLNFGR